jgi:uncharacterized protein (DUF849 family)
LVEPYGEMAPVIDVALNGSRTREEHPGIPRTPAELADAARASVDAGGRVLHLHAFDDEGTETLDSASCSHALRAVRALCASAPISLTTSEGVEPDPKRRLELIADWFDLPDLVTANMGEAGILELCEYLGGRGVGIEAGLLSLDDAEKFVRSRAAGRCTRVLIEPLDADPVDAIAHAEAMENVLAAAEISLEQVHHGDGIASWAVSERAVRRRHGMRTGLEDTTVMPDGKPAADNAALVRAAMVMVDQFP